MNDPGLEAWQPRIFGRDILETRRGKATLDKVRPNPTQPRQGPKKDPQLKAEILDNGGIFEPLLVEPHPEVPDVYRIIDGERRHANSEEIVKDLKSGGASEEEVERYSVVPIEVTKRALSDEERFRVWVYIHRQRKEWTRREKEMVAYSLVTHMDRARAAAVLGISVRELDKTVAVYETSTKLTGLKDPDAAITWAREINNVSPKYRAPEVEDALIRKVNEGKLVNSKEVRELRRIAPHETALEEFLSDSGTISSALERLPQQNQPAPQLPGVRISFGQGIASDIHTFTQHLGRYSWEDLEEIRDDPKVLEAIAEAESKLLRLKEAFARRSRASRRRG